MKLSLRERYFPLCRSFLHRVKRWRGGGTTFYSCGKTHGKKLTRIDYSFDCPEHPEIAGKKILFISDLHWNDSTKNRLIAAEIAAIISASRPDYLILGGDQCGDAETLDSLQPVLTAMAAMVPCTLAVNGNWESGKEWLRADFWQEFYRSCGIRHLCNQYFADEFFGFSGVDDVSTGNCELPLLPEQDRDKFKVLLAHSPDSVIALDSVKSNMRTYSLALCGHTHGGQVRFFGPVRPRSRYGRRFDRGIMYHEAADLQMLISAGAGELSFPWRFNCRRDVALIEFTCGRKLR